MNKTLLIISREFLTRVRSKQFLIATLLGPLMMVIISVVGYFIGKSAVETEATIYVKDNSGLFKDRLQNSGNLKFQFTTEPDSSIKTIIKNTSNTGLLTIPAEFDIYNPLDVTYFSDEPPGQVIMDFAEKGIKTQIESRKLLEMGLTEGKIDSIRTKFDIAVKVDKGKGKGEQASSTAAASAIGFFLGFLMYLFMFLYGVQVMRGVAEEKSNRIIEVIASSAKPIQLMLGKIIGIGSVGIFQFVLWIVLGWTVLLIATPLLGLDINDMQNAQQIPGGMAGSANQAQGFAGAMQAIGTLNIPFLAAMFLFYFLGGYFLYAALFAAVGSAVDNDQDTQQLVFPITIPIILSLMAVQFVMLSPNSSVSFWFSIIPFTSPIVMVARLPFDPPMWQIALSMVLLIIGFIFTTWMAARIYRVGILMYGKKPTFKELGKWLFYKG